MPRHGSSLRRQAVCRRAIPLVWPSSSARLAPDRACPTPDPARPRRPGQLRRALGISSRGSRGTPLDRWSARWPISPGVGNRLTDGSRLAMTAATQPRAGLHARPSETSGRLFFLCAASSRPMSPASATLEAGPFSSTRTNSGPITVRSSGCSTRSATAAAGCSGRRPLRTCRSATSPGAWWRC